MASHSGSRHRGLAIRCVSWFLLTILLAGREVRAQCQWPLETLSPVWQCSSPDDWAAFRYESISLSLTLHGVPLDYDLVWVSPDGRTLSPVIEDGQAVAAGTEYQFASVTSSTDRCFRNWTIAIQSARQQDGGVWTAMLKHKTDKSAAAIRIFTSTDSITILTIFGANCPVGDPRLTCQNGGTCVFNSRCCNPPPCARSHCRQLDDPIFCYCPPGFKGKRCQISTTCSQSIITDGTVTTVTVNKTCPVNHTAPPCPNNGRWLVLGAKANQNLTLQLDDAAKANNKVFRCNNSGQSISVVVQYPPRVCLTVNDCPDLRHQVLSVRVCSAPDKVGPFPCAIAPGNPPGKVSFSISTPERGACSFLPFEMEGITCPAQIGQLLNHTTYRVCNQTLNNPLPFNLSRSYKLLQQCRHTAACYRCTVENTVFGSVKADVLYTPVQDPCNSGKEPACDPPGDRISPDQLVNGSMFVNGKACSGRCFVLDGQSVVITAALAHGTGVAPYSTSWTADGVNVNSSIFLAASAYDSQCNTFTQIAIGSMAKPFQGTYTVKFWRSECQQPFTVHPPIELVLKGLPVFTPAMKAVVGCSVTVLLLIIIVTVVVFRQHARQSERRIYRQLGDAQKEGSLSWKQLIPLATFLSADWVKFLSAIDFPDYSIGRCQASHPSDVLKQAEMALLIWFQTIRGQDIEGWTVEKLMGHLAENGLVSAADYWKERLAKNGTGLVSSESRNIPSRLQSHVSPAEAGSASPDAHCSPDSGHGTDVAPSLARTSSNSPTDERRPRTSSNPPADERRPLLSRNGQAASDSEEVSLGGPVN